MRVSKRVYECRNRFVASGPEHPVFFLSFLSYRQWTISTTLRACSIGIIKVSFGIDPQERTRGAVLNRLSYKMRLSPIRVTSRHRTVFCFRFQSLEVTRKYRIYLSRQKFKATQKLVGLRIVAKFNTLFRNRQSTKHTFVLFTYAQNPRQPNLCLYSSARSVSSQSIACPLQNLQGTHAVLRLLSQHSSWELRQIFQLL